MNDTFAGLYLESQGWGGGGDSRKLTTSAPKFWREWGILYSICIEGPFSVDRYRNNNFLQNSYWPSDPIWWPRSGSTLAQVMAFLNQCWLLKEFLWQSSASNLTSAQATILYNEFENYTFKITATSPRSQWVKGQTDGQTNRWRLPWQYPSLHPRGLWLQICDTQLGDIKWYVVLLIATQTPTKWETQIARFMWPTWGPPGSCRSQLGPMSAPRTLLSGK